MSPTQTSIGRRAATRASVRRRLDSRVPALRLLPDPSHSHAGSDDGARSAQLPAEPRPQPPRTPAGAGACGADAQPPALRVVAGPSRILLAGADAGRRATLLDELSRTLPRSTVFEQADAVCEALEHAPASRMAFIAGDLDDATAESLMQTLAHRHPELPVLIVDGPAAAAAAEAHGRPRAIVYNDDSNDELRLRHA